MHFEHLIQINDPLNPFVETMTREQLWEGLVLRAEQPQLFVLGLDSCTILSRTDSTLERELHYGQATVCDRVTLSVETGDEGTTIDRKVTLEGDLSDEQRERLLQIANACPVHKILTRPISVRTGLTAA